MKFLQKKNQSGFTIIEVMIVLAIAGVIMVALFLAVPALQRSSRNNQRAADASSIAAAVNECLNARNGKKDSCDTTAEMVPAFLDTAVASTKLKYLTTVTFALTAPVQPAVGDVVTVNVGFVAKCSPDGSGVIAGTQREFAVLYNSENANGSSVTRCLSS